MAILNYTTKVDPIKTIGEISQCLVKHGVKKIITDYDDEGLPIGVTFQIDFRGQMLAFNLPCNWQGVLKALEKAPKATRTKEQALRVSWRILKDWVEAQMAIVEAELATMVEVFLPYALTEDGTTIFQKIQSGKIKLLA